MAYNLLPFTDLLVLFFCFFGFFFSLFLSVLSVLGWNANRESLSAVIRTIERFRHVLNLADYPKIYNASIDELISYLEKNPLKYCVLVLDAEKVKSVREGKRVDYVRLLQTAEENVGKMFLLKLKFNFL